MRVTIKDVAEKAKVSPSTVSRVLADSDKISDATKKKVRKVIEELGYHINLNARTLVQQSTQTIGVVMKHSASESLHNPFFPELLRGISSKCNEQDYSLLLTTGNSEEAIYKEVIKMVQGKIVDGIIVTYSKKDDKVVPYLLENNFPFVVIGKPVENADQIMHVDNDNVLAGEKVTEYLINLGHKRIAFVGSEPEYQVIQDRMTGFYNIMRKHELDVPEHYVQLGSWNNGVDRQKVRELFKEEPPTAIIAAADTIALYLTSALEEMNLKIPDDVSVITFNNTIISQLATPNMTSVDIQTFQLGSEGTKSLIELVKNPDTFKKSIIIPTIIVERESTRPFKE